jgi:hypothetical protein
VVGVVAVRIACFLLLTLLVRVEVIPNDLPFEEVFEFGSLILTGVLAGHYGEKYDPLNPLRNTAFTIVSITCAYFLTSGIFASKPALWMTGKLCGVTAIALFSASVKAGIRNPSAAPPGD